MAKKYNYAKITAVVFLTVLIWVWADLALDEDFIVSNAAVSVAKFTNPNLAVSFADESSLSRQKIILREIKLNGPASRITKMRKRLKEGEKLDFDFDAVLEKMDLPGDYSLDLLPFLQKDEELKQLGLTVVSCDPTEISVNVLKLLRKSLTVQCLDQNGSSLEVENIEPEKVDMLVPENWTGEQLIAYIKLTQREIAQARLSPIPKTPYIQSPLGQTTNVPTTVRIKTLPEKDLRRDFTITKVTPKYCFSVILQGKYWVDVKNFNDVMQPISISATPAAKLAYENMSYQVRLEIDDEDADPDKPLRRKKLSYNFPPDYLRSKEIELKGPPVVVDFELISITSPQ
ncbi:MAG: hypothetical protein ACYS1A_13210 [Planctomycetota bacterium]|jgi:hypothetical protein